MGLGVYEQPAKVRKGKRRPKGPKRHDEAFEVWCGSAMLGVVLVGVAPDRAPGDTALLPGQSLGDFRQQLQQQLGHLPQSRSGFRGRALNSKDNVSGRLPSSFLFCWEDGVAIHRDQEHRLSVLRVAGLAVDGQRRVRLEAVNDWEEGVQQTARPAATFSRPSHSAGTPSLPTNSPPRDEGDAAAYPEWQRLLGAQGAACVFVSFEDSSEAEIELVKAQVMRFAASVAATIQSIVRAWLSRRRWSAVMAAARERASASVAALRRSREKANSDARAQAENERAVTKARSRERAKAEVRDREKAAAALQAQDDAETSRVNEEALAATAALEALKRAAWVRATDEAGSGVKAAKEESQRLGAETSRLIHEAQRTDEKSAVARDLELAEKARRLAVVFDVVSTDKGLGMANYSAACNRRVAFAEARKTVRAVSLVQRLARGLAARRKTQINPSQVAVSEGATHGGRGGTAAISEAIDACAAEFGFDQGLGLTCDATRLEVAAAAELIRAASDAANASREAALRSQLQAAAGDVVAEAESREAAAAAAASHAHRMLEDHLAIVASVMATAVDDFRNDKTSSQVIESGTVTAISKVSMYLADDWSFFEQPRREATLAQAESALADSREAAMSARRTYDAAAAVTRAAEVHAEARAKEGRAAGLVRALVRSRALAAAALGRQKAKAMVAIVERALATGHEEIAVATTEAVEAEAESFNIATFYSDGCAPEVTMPETAVPSEVAKADTPTGRSDDVHMTLGRGDCIVPEAALPSDRANKRGRKGGWVGVSLSEGVSRRWAPVMHLIWDGLEEWERSARGDYDGKSDDGSSNADMAASVAGSASTEDSLVESPPNPFEEWCSGFTLQKKHLARHCDPRSRFLDNPSPTEVALPTPSDPSAAILLPVPVPMDSLLGSVTARPTQVDGSRLPQSSTTEVCNIDLLPSPSLVKAKPSVRADADPAVDVCTKGSDPAATPLPSKVDLFSIDTDAKPLPVLVRARRSNRARFDAAGSAASEVLLIVGSTGGEMGSASAVPLTRVTSPRMICPGLSDIASVRAAPDPKGPQSIEVVASAPSRIAELRDGLRDFGPALSDGALQHWETSSLPPPTLALAPSSRAEQFDEDILTVGRADEKGFPSAFPLARVTSPRFDGPGQSEIASARAAPDPKDPQSIDIDASAPSQTAELRDFGPLLSDGALQHWGTPSLPPPALALVPSSRAERFDAGQSNLNHIPGNLGVPFPPTLTRQYSSLQMHPGSADLGNARTVALSAPQKAEFQDFLPAGHVGLNSQPIRNDSFDHDFRVDVGPSIAATMNRPQSLRSPVVTHGHATAAVASPFYNQPQQSLRSPVVTHGYATAAVALPYGFTAPQRLLFDEKDTESKQGVVPIGGLPMIQFLEDAGSLSAPGAVSNGGDDCCGEDEDSSSSVDDHVGMVALAGRNARHVCGVQVAGLRLLAWLETTIVADTDRDDMSSSDCDTDRDEIDQVAAAAGRLIAGAFHVQTARVLGPAVVTSSAWVEACAVAASRGGNCSAADAAGVLFGWLRVLGDGSLTVVVPQDAGGSAFESFQQAASSRSAGELSVDSAHIVEELEAAVEVASPAIGALHVLSKGVLVEGRNLLVTVFVLPSTFPSIDSASSLTITALELSDVAGPPQRTHALQVDNAAVTRAARELPEAPLGSNLTSGAGDELLQNGPMCLVAAALLRRLAFNASGELVLNVNGEDDEEDIDSIAESADGCSIDSSRVVGTGPSSCDVSLPLYSDTVLCSDGRLLLVSVFDDAIDGLSSKGVLVVEAIEAATNTSHIVVFDPRERGLDWPALSLAERHATAREVCSSVSFDAAPRQIEGALAGLVVAWPTSDGQSFHPMEPVWQLHASAVPLVACALHKRGASGSMVVVTAFEDGDSLLVCGVDPRASLHYAARSSFPLYLRDGDGDGDGDGWDISLEAKAAYARTLLLGGGLDVWESSDGGDHARLAAARHDDVTPSSGRGLVLRRDSTDELTDRSSPLRALYSPRMTPRGSLDASPPSSPVSFTPPASPSSARAARSRAIAPLVTGRRVSGVDLLCRAEVSVRTGTITVSAFDPGRGVALGSATVSAEDATRRFGPRLIEGLGVDSRNSDTDASASVDWANALEAILDSTSLSGDGRLIVCG